MRVKEDKARQVVEINGIELSGWISKKRCTKCGAALIYHQQHDEEFCPKCNEWVEPETTDPGWTKFN
jgi:hypothetical protein